LSSAAEFDDLVCEVEHAGAIPDAALRGLVPHAAALQVRVEALIDKRSADQWLYPGEDNLLFYGLFVLSAARAHAFWPAWARLLREAERAESLFGDGIAQSVAGISLGLAGDAPEDIAALAAHQDVPELARVGLLNALARLTCDGRFSRDDFLALIDKLAVLGASSDPEARLWALQEAIALAGLWERLGLLEGLWALFPDGVLRDVDHADIREATKAAARNPADMDRFEESEIAMPNDPNDGLRWLKRIDERDVAAKDALDWREREYLTAFLERTRSRQTGMSFEELDGFFHALVLGPELIMPSRYLPVIWGEDHAFDDEVALHRVLGLLQRHWNAIAKRNAGFIQPVLAIEPQDGRPPGQVWAQGFMRGVSLCVDSWAGLGEDEVHFLALQEIADLARDELSIEERTALLEELPANVMGLGQYWQDMRAPRTPRTVKKVGRNTACPCGSGLKWKKCCGASSPTDLQ
jgi:uncharacterized protein